MPLWVIQQDKVDVGQKMMVGKLEYRVVEAVSRAPIGEQIAIETTKEWNRANTPRYPAIPMPPEPAPFWHMRLVR